MAERIQIIQKNLDLLIDQITETEGRRRAENVLAEAKNLAPRSDGSRSFTDGRRGITNGGRLAESLKIGITISHGKKVVRIFSDATNSRGQQYANYVVKGTRGHVIIGNPNLAFQWISRGVFVITPQVLHPGTAPNDFLTRALFTAFNR